MSFPPTNEAKLIDRWKPANEATRLKEVEELEIFGVDPIEEIDRITALANRIIGADDVGVNIVGEDCQYFLSSTLPLPPEFKSSSRYNSCCATVVLTSSPLVIRDLQRDERFNEHPLVKSGVKSYLGVPLITELGHTLGTLCAYNNEEIKDWTEGDLEMMKEFARMAERAIQLRKATLKSFKDSAVEEMKSNQLIEEKKTLLAGLRSFPQGVFMWDSKSKSISFVNESFQQLTGWDSQDIYSHIGSPSIFWLSNETSSRLFQDLFASQIKETSLEFEATKKNGNKYWASIHIAPVLDCHSLLTSCFGTIFDITQRKEHEIEMAKNRDDAQQAVKAKNAFLANMSHEIKIPLNTICESSDALCKCEKQSEEQKELSKMMNNSSYALLGLVNDILDFSRLESESIELEMTVFCLRDAIEECISLHYPNAIKSGNVVTYDIEGGIPEFICLDISRLKQILQKLISNAITFTENGEIHISVSSIESDLSSKGDERIPRLQFVIKDTGIGMKKETSEWIFQSFWQVDQSRSRRHGGTGLGLAISKKLAIAMGGDMWFHSTYGSGSAFTFTVSNNDPSALRSHSPLPKDSQNYPQFGSSNREFDIIRPIATRGKRRMSIVQSPIRVISFGSEAKMLSSMLRTLNFPYILQESVPSIEQEESLSGLLILGLEANKATLNREFNVASLRLSRFYTPPTTIRRESPGVLCYPIQLKSLEKTINETMDRFMLLPPFKKSTSVNPESIET